MTDGSTIPTSDLYASNKDSRSRPAVPEPSTDDDIALGEFVQTLRSRGDKGAPFWDALRKQMDNVSDDEPARSWKPKSTTSADPIVYYIRFGDRVKIGTTTNLKARLGVVPHDEVLATEPGGRDVERARHVQFAATRITREWFAYSTELKQHIARLT